MSNNSSPCSKIKIEFHVTVVILFRPGSKNFNFGITVHCSFKKILNNVSEIYIDLFQRPTMVDYRKLINMTQHEECFCFVSYCEMG